MKPQVAERLEQLRKRFAILVGRPFRHFFCPILFVDEKTELCQAHIVNRAFGGASSKWTIQRKDVDNFYGSMFEDKFLNLQCREPGVAIRAIMDPGLYRRLRPRILVDGVEVKYFVAKAAVPKEFAELRLEREDETVHLGLKLPPGVNVREDSDWQFEVSHDLRIPAFVSVLKAAHLTLFQILDYTYALGAGGQLLGSLLGTFYLQNKGSRKEDVAWLAVEYFRPWAALVRPVSSGPAAITGTVDDNWLHFCWSDDPNDLTPWGILIYVRAGGMLHAALLPAFEHAEGANRFARFLASESDSFEVSIARFEGTH